MQDGTIRFSTLFIGIDSEILNKLKCYEIFEKTTGTIFWTKAS